MVDLWETEWTLLISSMRESTLNKAKSRKSVIHLKLTPFFATDGLCWLTFVWLLIPIMGDKQANEHHKCIAVSHKPRGIHSSSPTMTQILQFYNANNMPISVLACDSPDIVSTHPRRQMEQSTGAHQWIHLAIRVGVCLYM